MKSIESVNSDFKDIWYEYCPDCVIVRFKRIDQGVFVGIKTDDLLVWMIEKGMIQWRDAFPKLNERVKEIFKPKYRTSIYWSPGCENTDKIIRVLKMYITENKIKGEVEHYDKA